MSLKAQVRNDITKCGDIIEARDQQQAEEFIDILTSAYEAWIPGIKNNLDLYYSPLDTSIDYIRGREESE